MATLDLSQILQPVDFSDPGSVSFGTFVASAPMLWQWLTPTGNLIDIVGTGMTFSAGHATGGTVSAIGFDLGNNGANPIEIQITGLSIAASLLDDSAESFWRILEGNDVILGPPASATPGALDVVTFFGDNLSVRPGVIKGGDDSIGMGTARAVIIGDVVDVGSDAPGATAVAYQGGADTMNGVATTFRQTVHGDAETVRASGALTGGNDIITLVGAALGTVVYGDAGTVRGTAGDFAAFIGGNDVIDARGCTADFITLEGDAGNQSFATFRGGNDILIGGSGRDTLVGDVHNQSGDVVCGNDTISGGGGNDSIVGDVHNAGNARIFGGNDIIRGGDGSDNIIGDAANLSSGTIQIGGHDKLFGDAGDDFITGRSGNDTMAGGAGADRMNGGDGIDTVTYIEAAAAVRADLLIPGSNTGEALGDTFIDVENLTGSIYADYLRGSVGANNLNGAIGNDDLVALAGNDLLTGGAGNDRLWGDTGADAFIFNAGLSTAANRDVIYDFSAVDDTMRLDHRFFPALGQTSGVLAAGAFFASATGLAHDASDRIIYNTTTGLLTYDSNGNAAGGVVQFAILSGAPTITNADFLVI